MQSTDIKPVSNPQYGSEQATLARIQLNITGVVQGVGFRPFVYRLAHELGLSGSVLNNSQGVLIIAQGPKDALTQFEQAFVLSPPPLSRIDNITSKPLATVANETAFTIIASENTQETQENADSCNNRNNANNSVVAVSPDKCTCDDCFSEISDINNRHFRYPFTNCTNCGPRYTLIKGLPYDRPNTAMASFAMCDRCANAYQNPLDRRYHAQPVSCPDCGPQLSFNTAALERLSDKEQALTDAVKALQEGKILAIKGLGGFHLVCDASNDASIALLRQRKHRPAKPFAIMVENPQVAAQYVYGNASEWQTLSSAERPITLMQKIAPSLSIGLKHQQNNLSELIAPAIDKLGVFLPYTPLHFLLLAQLKRPLVMTSANLSGEPIIIDALDIKQKLGHVVDFILDHNRPILNACDDSVVQVINDKVQVLRLARGYAPLSLYCEQAIPQATLAVGAQQKNTVCFGFKQNIFLSPHIGDLVSIKALDYFHHTLATFKTLYQFEPKKLVHDTHPDYATSLWAEKQAPQKMMVQHHYAHVLSVMAANNYIDSVLGFAFDGTGLGDDGTLWGGEALVCNNQKYQRLTHLMPFQLIGGEQAIKQPNRVLLSILLEKYSPEEIQALQLPAFTKMANFTFNNLTKVWRANISVKTSSIGRLFDAVAVALGLIDEIQYEGQAGMLLEAAANSLTQHTRINDTHQRSEDALNAEKLQKNDKGMNISDGYSFDKDSFDNHSFDKHSFANNALGGSVDDANNLAVKTGEYTENPIPFSIKHNRNVWDSADLIMQIINAITAEPLTPVRVALIARSFMDALSDIVCLTAKDHVELPIVLCGGVFQNKYLLQRCETALIAQGNRVLDPKYVPINDAGISLGQLWHSLATKY
ncbi:carbamoyltransferase HypF [Shewanella sp. 1CM18E]|uniref:carbamoyltransferase HypF n=1 Tax=Shewanella sp. 1CM18E TaxID=2929169 RepID=UPI00202B8EC2|nr:carbamoyltransferase HypF [Shewanella sp. 1CM18E]MCK8046458.1 carbamoyltransferase HypF [Shewanella sp. 1CM18E]